METAKGSKNVWIFAETAEKGLKGVVLELASEGRIVADGLNEQLCAVVLDQDNNNLTECLSEYGVDTVFDVMTRNGPDVSTHALSRLICKYNPRLVLIGATPLGIELAPRVSARNQIDLFTNCLILSLNNRDSINATKLIFGENAYATFKIPISETQIITVIPGSFNTNQGQQRATKRILENMEQEQSRVKYLEFVKGDPQKIDISLAEVIVALGKGSGGESETVKKIERLAELLGGSLGGSRPTVDQGWLPFERQIGQTGKTVSPKLLVALGISGAFEFISGMKDSKFVIAINKDPKAPIFKVANLSFVGDLHEIVCEIVKKLESRLEGEVS